MQKLIIKSPDHDPAPGRRVGCAKKKIVRAGAFLLIFAVLTTFAAVPAAALSDPEIRAEGALLIEPNSETILYAKNERKVLYPASLTKIMTVMLAVEAVERGEITLDTLVTASGTFDIDLEADGSTLGIMPGEILTFEDLLYGAMVKSANEACNIIAETLAGNREAFVELMNERARELGCDDTHFANAHGLHNDMHYTTAYDLYLITKQALTYPLFVEICNTISYEISATNLSDSRHFYTSNRLISNLSGALYYYDRARGVKTGYTSKAGYCLVSTAEKDGINVISVVLGCELVPQEDESYLMENFTETKRLMQWGFSSYRYKDIVTSSDLIYELTVLMGEGADSVILHPSGSISALLPDNFDLSALEHEIRWYIDPVENEDDGEGETYAATAPVAKDEIFAELVVYDGDAELGRVQLAALNAVERSSIDYVKHKVWQTLDQTWLKITIAVILLLFLGYIAFVIRYNILRKRRREGAKRTRNKQQ